MMGHTVTFYASGNKIEVKWIKDADKLAHFMSIAKKHLHGHTSPPSPVESDLMTQLRRPGELRDAGVITEEEFSAKKAELLKRL